MRSLLLSLTLVLASCASPGTVSSSVVKKNLDVISPRTITYIRNDPQAPAGLLWQVELSTNAMRTQAEGKKRLVAERWIERVIAICNVHDTYISGDSALDGVRKAHFLRTSRLFRQLFAEAVGDQGE